MNFVAFEMFPSKKHSASICCWLWKQAEDMKR